MTTEEKRIKIAQACGLRSYLECSDHGEIAPHQVVRTIMGHQYCNQCGNDLKQKKLPDYFNDLNACHEMEKALSEFQHHHFAHWLHHDLGHKSVSAPSAIRAERFGLTLKLWTEGE